MHADSPARSRIPLRGMVFGSRLQDTAFDIGLVCLCSDLARSRDLPEIHGQYPAARRRGHGQLLYRPCAEHLLFVRRRDDGQRPYDTQRHPQTSVGRLCPRTVGDGNVERDDR